MGSVVKLLSSSAEDKGSREERVDWPHLLPSDYRFTFLNAFTMAHTYSGVTPKVCNTT